MNQNKQIIYNYKHVHGTSNRNEIYIIYENLSIFFDIYEKIIESIENNNKFFLYLEESLDDFMYYKNIFKFYDKSLYFRDYEYILNSKNILIDGHNNMSLDINIILNNLQEFKNYCNKLKKIIKKNKNFFIKKIKLMENITDAEIENLNLPKFDNPEITKFTRKYLVKFIFFQLCFGNKDNLIKIYEYINKKKYNYPLVYKNRIVSKAVFKNLNVYTTYKYINFNYYKEIYIKIIKLKNEIYKYIKKKDISKNIKYNSVKFNKLYYTFFNMKIFLYLLAYSNIDILKYFLIFYIYFNIKFQDIKNNTLFYFEKFISILDVNLKIDIINNITHEGYLYDKQIFDKDKKKIFNYLDRNKKEEIKKNLDKVFDITIYNIDYNLVNNITNDINELLDNELKTQHDDLINMLETLIFYRELSVIEQINYNKKYKNATNCLIYGGAHNFKRYEQMYNINIIEKKFLFNLLNIYKNLDVDSISNSKTDPNVKENKKKYIGKYKLRFSRKKNSKKKYI